MRTKRTRGAARKLRLSPIVFAAVCVFALLAGQQLRSATAPAPTADSPYSVHFLDVGQGDCALLLADGDAVLIDAGPTAAGDTVVQYLQQLGVTRLRAVIASHPHEDHIGGMAAVLRAFPVDAFYLPHAVANTQCFSKMLDGLEAQKCTPTVPADGDTFAAGGMTFTFFGTDTAKNPENLNNSSLVVRADTGAERLLFVGDAETEPLNALAASGADLACDIYKVGHHGSSNSSPAAFLAAARPRIAVISYAADNSYGHPHDKTLRRLEKIGAKIYRTAVDGTVVFPLTPPALSQKENVS